MLSAHLLSFAALQQLISIINDLTATPPATRNEDAIIDPRVSWIARFHGQVEAHLELIGLDARVFAKFLEHSFGSCASAGCLEVDGCAVVRDEVVACVEVGCLGVAMVADDLPVCDIASISEHDLVLG